jgi:nicotinamidase/pyrazinamidase
VNQLRGKERGYSTGQDTRSRSVALWEVDVQNDFMLPEGALAAAGAMSIVPRIARLVDAARERRAVLIASADAHAESDAELREWPPHCMRGTAGAELLAEAGAASRLTVPNRKDFALPADLGEFQQIVIEKNTLDVFNNPQTEEVLRRLAEGGALEAGALFLVFGVVTEHCVRLAAEGLLRRGWRVGLVADAICALDAEQGRRTVRSLADSGAKVLRTEEALEMLEVGGSGMGDSQG